MLTMYFFWEGEGLRSFLLLTFLIVVLQAEIFLNFFFYYNFLNTKTAKIMGACLTLIICLFVILIKEWQGQHRSQLRLVQIPDGPRHSLQSNFNQNIVELCPAMVTCSSFNHSPQYKIIWLFLCIVLCSLGPKTDIALSWEQLNFHFFLS